MKKILTLISLLIITTTAMSQKIVPCSCKDQATGKLQYGYCDSLRTKYIIECQFDSAYYLSNGLAKVIKDGKIGYLDVSGKLVIPAVYEEGEDFSEGFAYVKKDGHYIYINKKGVNQFNKNFPLPSMLKMAGLSDETRKMLLQQINTMKQECRFSDGLARFFDTANKRMGFIDTKGIVVLPAKYAFATKFSSGIAIVKESPTELTKGIDKSGKELFSIEADITAMGEYKNGFIKIMKRHSDGMKYNYMDTKGRILYPVFYDDVAEIKNGFVVVSSKPSSGSAKKMGAGNLLGKILIEPGNDYLESSAIKGIFFYSNRNSKGVLEAYGLMDSTGRKITGINYFEFEKANDTTFVARKKESLYDNKFCHYTLLSVISGKELCKPDYLYKEWNTVKGQSILYLFDSRYNSGASNRQNWCLYNPKAGVLAEYFNDLVQTNKKLGLFIAPKEGRIFDLMGRTILDSAACITLNEYRDDVPKIESDVVLVKGEKTRKWYAYNMATGKIIINDIEVWSEAYMTHKKLNEGMLPVKQKGLWGFSDANGRMIIPCKYKAANAFYFGWALVEADEGESFFIDKTGKKMPGIKIGFADDFYWGVAKVRSPYSDSNDEFTFYINPAGKTIFKPENPDFFANGEMRDGLAAVCNKSNKYGYIDKTGKLVIPYQFELPKDAKFPHSLEFKDGKAIVVKDGRTIRIDKTGKEIK